MPEPADGVIRPGQRHEGGFLHANSASDVRAGLELCGEHSLVPSHAVYEPGFLRTGAALHAAVPGSRGPVYRFMFSTAFAFGLSPVAWALDSYLRVGLEDAPPGCPGTNAEMVAEACRAVQQAGRPLATASEVRRATAGSDPRPSARTRRRARRSARRPEARDAPSGRGRPFRGGPGSPGWHVWWTPGTEW